jgi:hypothetical protein
MKKKIAALLALVLAFSLAGCAGGEEQTSNLTLDQLAVRMSLKELGEGDIAAYAPVMAEMQGDEFDDFVTKVMTETDKNTDWTLLQTNFAHLGMALELPQRSTEEQSEFFVLESFSIRRPDQTSLHLYFHLYSTWFESQGMDPDGITLCFDPEKLTYVSGYTSDPIAVLADSGKEGEVVFTYEDRKATDPAPFDGDDRHGEVLVAVRVEPIADGEAAHSATLKHTGSKENFEITVEDTVALF